jgi:hypothetical protein
MIDKASSHPILTQETMSLVLFPPRALRAMTSSVSVINGDHRLPSVQYSSSASGSGHAACAVCKVKGGRFEFSVRSVRGGAAPQIAHQSSARALGKYIKP